MGNFTASEVLRQHLVDALSDLQLVEHGGDEAEVVEDLALIGSLHAFPRERWGLKGSYNINSLRRWRQFSHAECRLGGCLAGGIVSGQLMAVLLANSGGAWDNAKKKSEAGWFGGKGTENHKARVICDTVDDPFKDTAGPALNPLIKVLNLVAVLIAPVVISTAVTTTTRLVVVVVAVAALTLAIRSSKRGSAADDPKAIAEVSQSLRLASHAGNGVPA